jgi:hypothetical protein
MIKSDSDCPVLLLEATVETLTLQCPKCQSDDVTRSRRKFWERFVLYCLNAQVFRCRDCKKRFWVGVEWGRVILGTMTAVVITGVIATMVFVLRHKEPPAPVQTAAPARQRRRLPPLPKGLPPLSSVPLPADEKTEPSAKKPATTTKSAAEAKKESAAKSAADAVSAAVAASTGAASNNAEPK